MCVCVCVCVISSPLSAKFLAPCPWQKRITRAYELHYRKLNTAKPVVDTTPPLALEVQKRERKRKKASKQKAFAEMERQNRQMNQKVWGNRRETQLWIGLD